MLRLITVILLFSSSGAAQYDEYESYQTFSDLDKFQRDYGLVFLPGLTYSSIKENNDVTGATVNDRSRSLLFYDLRLGYIFRGGFYFGILYAGEAVDINSAAPKNERESVGLSFGYMHWGWALTGTFYPYSKQTLVGSGATDVSVYSEGIGYQVDAAYYFRLGHYFSIGPQIVYKSLSYGKAESASTSVNANANSQHDIFTPMVSLLINLYRG